MTDFAFSDCTPAMVAAVCNGCGARSGWQAWIRPPQGHAVVHCNAHDVDYRRGGTKSDRKAADRKLLRGLMQDMKLRRWWQKPGFFIKAYLYYLAVRALGRYNFHFGEKRDWEWFRTHYDMAAPEKPPSFFAMQELARTALLYNGIIV